MDTPQFPGFEIIEVMPRGGMSTVYKARQISLDRIVALKALPPMLAADPTDLDQFLTEARITANLKHPNIVQVYDFGHTEEGVYYFVMEFISGYSVGDWIRRKHCLSEQNSLLVAMSVAEALNYAWQNAGVVHCDIKPDNIIIDGDGTVKVADLGLARSVRSVVHDAKASAGMVFGTPNYISPEQSRGDLELDCRADIYSLGATLYNAMGGKMPFEGEPALAAMDLQITDQIPDVQDLNSHISIEASFLLEKMLAKDRDQRQADWDAVQTDINLVIQHKKPHGALPPPGASTMRRSAHRGIRPRVKASVTLSIPVITAEQAPDNSEFLNMQRQFSLKQKQRARLKPAWWFAGVIALIVLIMGIMLAHNLMRIKERPVSSIVQGGRPTTSKTPASTESRAERDENAGKMLAFAQQWAEDNPQRLEEMIQNFRKVAQETRGTAYSLQAQAAVSKCQEQLLAVKATVMRDLENLAAPLCASSEFARAAAIYEKYQGDWAAETEASRGIVARGLMERDQEYREQQQKIADEKERQRQKDAEETDHLMHQLLDRVCASLFEGDIPNALASVQKAAATPALVSRKEQMDALASILTEASLMDQRIINTFRAFKGREINVALVGGTEKVTIKDVQADTVKAEENIKVGAGHITRPKSFRVADLALSEKRLRLTTDANPGTALMQGLLSVQEKDWATAESWFAKTDPLLSSALLASVDKKKSAQAEEQAKHELLGILRNARLVMPGENATCDEYLAAITKRGFSARETEILIKVIESYQASFGQTHFARQYEPVLKRLTQTPTPESEPPPANPPQENIQQPPADGTPESVKTQLLERNRDLTLTGSELPVNEHGKVVRVNICRSMLKDLRPLVGLSDVHSINISDNPALSDIAPLRGMQLRELNISGTQVKDISVLMGMPLAKLNLANTKIMDINVLKGMAVSDLNIEGIKIRDISVLRTMPLKLLNLNNTEVGDLAPLKGNLSLEYLSLVRTSVRDIAPLNGMSLVTLNIGSTQIRDLGVLAEMPLKVLNMPNTKVRDFSFLSKLQLTQLNISQNDFNDLTRLKGMPLKNLDISGTQVKEQDFIVLQNMPLEELNLNNTAISDLAVLQGIKSLKQLHIMHTQIRNFEPLLEMPIQSLWLNIDNQQFRDKIWDVLRRMPNLRQLNGQGLFVDGGRHRRQ